MSDNRISGTLTVDELREALGLGGANAAVEEVGEVYDGQALIKQFADLHPVDTNGKWWKWAVARVPTRILYDGAGEETGRETELLEANERFIEVTYGKKTTWGMAFASVVALPAVDVDGSEIDGLACVPNVNMLDGVDKAYAHGKVDKTVRLILQAGYMKDKA